MTTVCVMSEMYGVSQDYYSSTGCIYPCHNANIHYFRHLIFTRREARKRGGLWPEWLGLVTLAKVNGLEDLGLFHHCHFLFFDFVQCLRISIH